MDMLIYCFNFRGWVTLTDRCVWVGGWVGYYWWYSGLISVGKMSKMLTSSPQPTYPSIREIILTLWLLSDILRVNMLEGKSHHVPDYRTGTRRGNTSNNPTEMKLADPVCGWVMIESCWGNIPGIMVTWQQYVHSLEEPRECNFTALMNITALNPDH